MNQDRNYKRDYPMTLGGNVFPIGNTWSVLLPDGTFHNDKFTMRDNAKQLLDQLNEVARRRGGRGSKQRFDKESA